jgi:hypothetical protein
MTHTSGSTQQHRDTGRGPIWIQTYTPVSSREERGRPPSARTVTVRPTETRNALIGLDRQEAPARLPVRGKLLLQRGVRGQSIPVRSSMPEAPAPLGRDANIAMCAGSVGATTPLGPVRRRKHKVWKDVGGTYLYICSCSHINTLHMILYVVDVMNYVPNSGSYQHSAAAYAWGIAGRCSQKRELSCIKGFLFWVAW